MQIDFYDVIVMRQEPQILRVGAMSCDVVCVDISSSIWGERTECGFRVCVPVVEIEASTSIPKSKATDGMSCSCYLICGTSAISNREHNAGITTVSQCTLDGRNTFCETIVARMEDLNWCIT